MSQVRHLPQGSLSLRAPEEPRSRVDVGPPFHKLLGGWLCLDFVNTVHAWMPPEGADGHGEGDAPLGDRLTSYDALVDWCLVAGVVDADDATTLKDAAALRPDDARTALERAHLLRRALYGLCLARLRERDLPVDALKVMESERAALCEGERLVELEGRVEVAWVGERDDLAGILWPVLRSALSLLSSSHTLERLRQCDGDQCGWFFVDVSRGGRRRWCDMADCGNVAKVRAHRSKRRVKAGTEKAR